MIKMVIFKPDDESFRKNKNNSNLRNKKCVVSECQFVKMNIFYKFGISVCTRYSNSNTMVMFHKGAIKVESNISSIFAMYVKWKKGFI